MNFKTIKKWFVTEWDLLCSQQYRNLLLNLISSLLPFIFVAQCLRYLFVDEQLAVTYLILAIVWVDRRIV